MTKSYKEFLEFIEANVAVSDRSNAEASGIDNASETLIDEGQSLEVSDYDESFWDNARDSVQFLLDCESLTRK